LSAVFLFRVAGSRFGEDSYIDVKSVSCFRGIIPGSMLFPCTGDKLTRLVYILTVSTASLGVSGLALTVGYGSCFAGS